jgi:hypothetical protein
MKTLSANHFPFKVIFIITTVLLATKICYACEPILPLAQVVGGPGYLLFSFWALISAVVLKSILFSQLQDNLPKVQAAWYMIVGNALSTLIGIAVMMVFMIPGILPATLVTTWMISRIPSKRLVLVSQNLFIRRLGPTGVSFVLIVLLVLSLVAFAAGQNAAAAERLTLYWFLKVLYVDFALIVSLVLTTFWEEWTINRMAARNWENTSFVLPAFRSNVVVLSIASIIGAFMMLPKRFQSADWLVELIGNILSAAA